MRGKRYPALNTTARQKGHARKMLKKPRLPAKKARVKPKAK
jgi:hypothetical protein